MVGGVDVMRCNLSRKQLKVEARWEEFTIRSLWGSRVLLACGDRIPGVVAWERQQLDVGAGEGQMI